MVRATKSTPERISVPSANGTYDVVIGAGLLSSLPDLAADRGITDNVAVVSCAPVWRRHGRRLARWQAASRRILIADGERAKTLASVANIYAALVKWRCDRSSTVVAFGGGVVGDVAGFAAATYLRGLRSIQVPTTLLAQVDSSVGGKTGVNLPSGKNLVGSFHSPALVVCDPGLLSTLPRREFQSGLYEVVKYAVIASETLVTRLETNLDRILLRDPDELAPLVADCCRIKAGIVTIDERESGPRRVLNFGHTIGHALEAITHYRRFRHGEAVGYGMLAAARLSVLRGTLAEDDEARLASLIARLGPLPPTRGLRATDAMDVIRRDKKVIAGRLHFVLAGGLGRTSIATDVSARELTLAMQAIGLR